MGELTLIGKNQLKGMDVHAGTLMTKVCFYVRDRICGH